MKNGEQKIGCENKGSNTNTKATIVSTFDHNCKREVNLAWTPPVKCTTEQIKNGETLNCRSKDDVYFFTFTVGSTKLDKFWVGQNTFGFYVNHFYD